jgi:L-seryl-tRNA(Ser) seleniumtransferase
MLSAGEDELRDRAGRLAAAIGPGATIEASVAKVGGGALPLLELPGPVVVVEGDPDDLAARLRAGDPPVAARIEHGRLLLDPRTVADDELGLVVHALSPSGRLLRRLRDRPPGDVT